MIIYLNGSHSCREPLLGYGWLDKLHKSDKTGAESLSNLPYLTFPSPCSSKPGFFHCVTLSFFLCIQKEPAKTSLAVLCKDQWISVLAGQRGSKYQSEYLSCISKYDFPNRPVSNLPTAFLDSILSELFDSRRAAGPELMRINFT